MKCEYTPSLLRMLRGRRGRAGAESETRELERERDVCAVDEPMHGKRYSSAMEENIFLFVPNIIGNLTSSLFH